MTAQPVKPRIAEPRRPYHVGVVVGLSTGLYAVALVGVTAAQINHDQDVIADRRPMQTAITLLGSTHTRVQLQLDAAWARYQEASGGYDQAAKGLAGLQTELERLARTITGIEGTRFSLPGRVSSPGAPVVRPAAAAPAPAPPATNGTTGASGKP